MAIIELKHFSEQTDRLSSKHSLKLRMLRVSQWFPRRLTIFQLVLVLSEGILRKSWNFSKSTSPQRASLNTRNCLSWYSTSASRRFDFSTERRSWLAIWYYRWTSGCWSWPFFTPITTTSSTDFVSSSLSQAFLTILLISLSLISLYNQRVRQVLERIQHTDLLTFNSWQTWARLWWRPPTTRWFLTLQCRLRTCPWCEWTFTCWSAITARTSVIFNGWSSCGSKTSKRWSESTTSPQRRQEVICSSLGCSWNSAESIRPFFCSAPLV